MMAVAAPSTPSTPLARLEDLARTDAAVAPLARLLIVAYRAAAGPAWDDGVPQLDSARLSAGLPLLHGQTLGAGARHVRRLASQIAAAAGEGGSEGANALRRALESGALNALAALEASVCLDTMRLQQLAGSAGVDADLLVALSQVLALPLLRACGRRAASLLHGAGWDAGYCPVCAAWPVLAERRGLERKRVLRCGRCGAEWAYGLQKCPYCANNDFSTLGYLAPEDEREARQAATCDACLSYLKTVTTVAALPPDELVVQDLTTLELDVAALERGFSRPDSPGFPLEVHVVAEAFPQRPNRWLPWKT